PSDATTFFVQTSIHIFLFFTLSTLTTSYRPPPHTTNIFGLMVKSRMFLKRNNAFPAEKAALFAQVLLPQRSSLQAVTDARILSVSSLKDSSSFTISRVTISINVRILPKLIRYTFQSLSSLNKRLTVFQPCSPASALSAKNPPVLPSRLS